LFLPLNGNCKFITNSGSITKKEAGQGHNGVPELLFFPFPSTSLLPPLPDGLHTPQSHEPHGIQKRDDSAMKTAKNGEKDKVIKLTSTLIAVAAAWAAPWMSGLERFAGELHSS
jgi:hypothetical protein